MKIKEAKIFNFGKLQGRTIRFGPGINVIYGENEAGKTTLHDFLTAMLFGMEKGRGRAAAGDVYKRYEPWHAPSYYSGALRFEVDKRPFYLERNFYHKERKDILRNETDGEELSIVYGDLTVLLGSITKEAFGNTYDIPQSGAATGKELAGILAEYLSDAAESGDGGTHVAKALAALSAKKKEKNLELKKQREQKQQEVNGLQIEKKLLEQDGRELRKEIAEAKAALSRMKKQYLLKEAEKGREEKQDFGRREAAREEGTFGKKKRLYFFGIAGMAAAAMLLQLMAYRTFSYADRIFWISQTILGMFMLAGLGAGVLAVRKNQNLKTGVTRNDAKMHRPEHNQDQSDENGAAATAQVEKMLGNLRDLLSEKETRLYNISEKIEEAAQPGWIERKLEEDIKALELAAGEIQRIARELCEEMEDELNAKVSGWVSKITAGRYDSIRVDADGKLMIETDGKELPPEALSRGTLEQIYLALRIAVGDIVSKEEQMPIFLDETFAMYDDTRLTGTLKALAAEQKQIFIFTCQKREMYLMEQAGITYYKAQME